jgi:Family of unknown function (DUF5709)
MPHRQEPSDPYEDAGLPATDDALPGKLITGDVQDEVVVPTTHATYVNAYGTTAREAELGEPLSSRLAHELPDITDIDEAYADDDYAENGGRVGRLIADDEGVRGDEDSDLWAGNVGTDGGGFSAEEDAMHLLPEDGF